MVIIKFKLFILKFYNKLNNFFIFFVKKISLQIFKYLAIQGLYALGINLIVYYDIIELNDDKIAFIRGLIILGFSAVSVYYYSNFFSTVFSKLQKNNVDKIENDDGDNSNLNNIENSKTNSDVNGNDSNSVFVTNNNGQDIAEIAEKHQHIADIHSRSYQIDILSLNDPDYIERLFLAKAIFASIIVVWAKHGW